MARLIELVEITSPEDLVDEHAQLPDTRGFGSKPDFCISDDDTAASVGLGGLDQSLAMWVE